MFPLRGTHVVYVLFGNTDTPVRIGMTQAFRAHLKRLDRDGMVWQSWKAWPCENHEDAVQTRKRITAQYGKPNIAASHHAPGQVRLPKIAVGSNDGTHDGDDITMARFNRPSGIPSPADTWLAGVHRSRTYVRARR